MLFGHSIVNLVFAAATLLAGCSPAAVFRDDGHYEVKPQTQVRGEGAVDLRTHRRKIFHATYSFTVSLAKRKTQVCTGTADMIGYSDNTTEMTGVIPCTGSRTIDLSTSVGQGLTAVPAKEALNLPHPGVLTWISSNGAATYDPPLPYTIGPIIQSAKSLLGFSMMQETKVRFTPTSGAPVDDHGIVSIAVLEAGIEFQPEGYAHPFTDVVHWERTVSGFSKVQKGEAFLYDRFEYWWSTKPIAIPRMRIEGPIGNFLPGSILTSLGEAIGVSLVVDMNLIDHTQL